MKRLLVIIFLFLAVPFSFAKDAASDLSSLDRADQFIIKKMRAEQGKSLAEIYQELGLVYLEKENFDRAFVYFRKATALDPKAWWAWYYMGVLKMEDPVEYFEKAIKANPRFAPPYYWLGRYYCKARNSRKSIKYFQDYLRLARTDPQEAPRMQTAAQFIELMNKGETDYARIVKKIESNY